MQHRPSYEDMSLDGNPATIDEESRGLKANGEDPFAPQRRLEAELAEARARIRELEAREADLRESEARLRLVCDHSPLRMGVVELLDDKPDDLRIVWVNRAFLEFYRTDLATVTGQNASDLGSTVESRRPWLEAYREAWRTGRAVMVEIFETRFDAWMQATLAPLRDGSTDAKRLAFIVNNITRRKKSEEALKRSEERWHLVMSQIPAIVWAIDRQARFTLSMGKGLEVLGLEANQVTGMSLTEYFGTSDPEFLPILCNMKALQGENGLYQTEWAGRFFSCHTRPLFNPQGEIEGALGIALDVTERIQAEVSLLESEQRFRMLFEDSPDAIFVEDLKGCVLDVNPAASRLHGMERQELIGKNVLELVPQEIRPHVWREFLRLATGEIKTLDGLSLRADGAAIPVELTASSVTYLGDEALLLHVRDVTERKQAEQSLKNAQDLELKLVESQKLESLGVLAGGIAHDFNNLLAVILGNASLLERMLPAGSPMRTPLEPILRTSERAAELCKQMLAYSGRGKFVVEPIDLNRLVGEMAGLLEISVAKKVKLRKWLEPGLPAVEADATQLRQVVMNLVLNAGEAIGDNPGEIEVRTRAAQGPKANGPGLVVLEVSDTGCGMDEETRAKMFDPFFTTKFTGRGLGLATVQGIVRGHRGTIAVESSVGEGTRFRIELPALPGTVMKRASDQKGIGNCGTSFKGVALIVDDEPGIRQLLIRMVKTFGFEVVVAGDGLEGLERFRENPSALALVILDLTMPRLDGEETFRLMHQVSPKLPVILMSGYSEQETAAKFVGQGVAGFLTKPFTLEKLEEKIRSVLGVSQGG